MKVLAVHSSRFGHTAAIVGKVAEILRASGHEVEVRPIEAIRKIDDEVEAVLVGASVRYGFFSPKVWSFAKKNPARLNAMPTGFIGVNLAAAKPEKKDPKDNAYARRFLQGIPWRPTAVRLFAGELDFRLYNRADAAMLKPILKASGKPWGPNVHIDYTDWDEVEEFAHEFARLLQ